MTSLLEAFDALHHDQGTYAGHHRTQHDVNKCADHVIGPSVRKVATWGIVAAGTPEERPNVRFPATGQMAEKLNQ